MKTLIFSSLLVALPALQAQEEFDSFVPPVKPNVISYRTLWEKSPFTEKEVIVAEEAPSFAENLQLEGIMSLDGEDVACLVDTSNEEVLYVRASEPTNGITLVEIKNRNDIDKASVVLASGNQRSTLGFSDEKLIPSPASGNKAIDPNTGTSNQTTAAGNQPQMNNGQAQTPTPKGADNSTLTAEQQRERRRQFWEAMRDRRSRGR